jgi:hypothetical protein
MRHGLRSPAAPQSLHPRTVPQLRSSVLQTPLPATGSSARTRLSHQHIISLGTALDGGYQADGSVTPVRWREPGPWDFQAGRGSGCESGIARSHGSRAGWMRVVFGCYTLSVGGLVCAEYGFIASRGAAHGALFKRFGIEIASSCILACWTVASMHYSG